MYTHRKKLLIVIFIVVHVLDEKVPSSKELSMSIQLGGVCIIFDGVIIFVLVFSRRRSTIERAFDEYTTCRVYINFYYDHYYFST